ncbi:ABC transporter ATP-binding protein [Bradyrhizobium erythrophlei]|jgi:NitT/TauT family transport system ATP-binding protein|uniref:NitT/TauT family transport system ATP-binding protein n=1 Tax=Bradyrhizobium erythrophlei TaxID=1437360 RepID=A0A1M7UE45_9BRAD|nr:ABC transporter ATP-binding protein [Bradyrhizobium erythrophlei]SHN81185.1 NitT/TauT family transport system ATP-binding protein [Bradyrhizobium erythrophlei]
MMGEHPAAIVSSAAGTNAGGSWSSETAAIELFGVTKTFGDGPKATPALGPLDLAIETGSFVSIVGPSGCGKSTLLRLIAGLEKPTGGRLRRYGDELDGPSRKVGIVFQDHVLFPWASVLENVMLPADVLSLPKAAALERAHWLLELTGLKDFAGHKPHMLSGGMKQRAAFCRAVLADPQLLLLDEPFGALDALTREELSLELSRLWQELGRTALLITHDLGEAILLGDRIVIMSDRPGRIRLDMRVDLPRPRDVHTMKDPRFIEIHQIARDLLFTRQRN